MGPLGSERRDLHTYICLSALQIPLRDSASAVLNNVNIEYLIHPTINNL